MPVDAAELRAALAGAIAGEVRFDRLDRAFIPPMPASTRSCRSASCLPKIEQTTCSPRWKSAPASACRSRPAAAAPRRRGSAIGPGVVLDFSKYFDRILEINAAEKWARVEPGVRARRSQSPGQAARLAVRSRHLHRQPGHHRRHDRQQFVRHPLDHSRQDHRSRPGTQGAARGRQSIIDAGPLSDAELATVRASGSGRGVLSHRSAAGPEHADGDRPPLSQNPAPRRRLQSGSHARAECLRECAIQPCHIFVGSEGTLGIMLEAKLRLVDVAEGQGAAASCSSPICSTPWKRRRGFSTHQPAAVEVIDRYILDSTKLNAEASPAARFPRSAIPAPSCIVEFYGDRPDDLPPTAGCLEADLRGAESATAFPSRAPDAGRAGAHLEAAQARARPVDGGEGGRQGDLLRRRHRRRPGAAARLHRRVPCR